ncbi:Class II aldolase/adducin [Lasiodiplodia theobromae]|uniref:Class ii aldolase adducin domain containing protein n=1 Tax=Lasiodiplodia theobromae TaxID=45133 RepID=UPI0015C350EC|nr:Class ii aldolase adducin domain containing protein [Lasiodiplodia theobromae]KAF4535646.1 Class ii aldolase adducin domain containing protein [Lasiodiplodia theobromae]KAF9638931.1 Class II aldolase/adducin [Lasiodiplodia theobromae]
MAPSAIEEKKEDAVVPFKPHGKEDMTPLQAISQGVSLPGIPLYSEIDKQRHFILSHMACAFRVFARKGFTEGMSGHISVRDPENPHTFWTNPLGKHFGQLKASDMILVDYDGKAIGGNMSRPANAAGFLIHSAVHKARPDANAACHTHSKAGKAWSAFARPLEMLNQDVCYFYGDAQAVYKDCGGIVFSEEEGKRLAGALGPNGKGMILRNHGLLTVGHTVDEAAYLYCLMERSCEVQLMVEAAAANGVPKVLVPDDAAQYTFKMGSDRESLYWEFQPDFEYEEEQCKGEFYN